MLRPVMPPMTMRLLLREAAESLFLQRCVACGRLGAALHSECLHTLTHAEAHRCLRCWRPGITGTCAACTAAPSAFQALRAPFRFDGVPRRALLEAKFAGISALLEPLAEAAAVVPPNWLIDAVAPVPLHPRCERQRGYNQPALLLRLLRSALVSLVSIDCCAAYG